MAANLNSIDDTFQVTYNALKGKCKNSVKNYAILKVAFASEEIALLYEKAIEKHNKAFLNNNFCDSGFDLFVPENASEFKTLHKGVNLKKKTALKGSFNYTFFPDGIYNVVVSKTGYATVNTKIDVVKGEMRKIDVEMKKM